MIVTEMTAKKKWCPHARVVECGDAELHGPFNRYHSSDSMGAKVDGGECRCLGSECMAWTWFEAKCDKCKGTGEFTKSKGQLVTPPKGSNLDKCPQCKGKGHLGTFNGPRRGFCGLTRQTKEDQ